jgi:hypothetical protein
MKRAAPEVQQFESLHLTENANMIRDKLASPLRNVPNVFFVWYLDVARDFVDKQPTNGTWNEPGITPDGLLVQTGYGVMRRHPDSISLRAQNIELPGYDEFEPHPEGKFEQTEKVAPGLTRVHSRFLGCATLRPLLGQSSAHFVDVGRTMEFGEAYTQAYCNEAVPPMGMLRGGYAGAVPLFPLNAFL